MNKLPIETLHNIFILLPLIQKLECMYVCRQWERIIRTQSLLHTIFIKHKRNFSAFIDMIERQRTKGKQVEYLTILNMGSEGRIMYGDFIYDNRKFLNLLPNLRQFHCKGLKLPSTSKSNFWKRPFEILNSNPSRIESIVETGACELTMQLMTSDLCTQLTKLELFPEEDFNTRKSIIPQLKNMSQLRQLKLRNVEFNLNDLETIHSNLPSLELISLVDINKIKGNVPFDILPVTSITHFSFSFISYVHQEQKSLLQYIHKKYTHLQHFHPNHAVSKLETYVNDGLNNMIEKFMRIQKEAIMPILGDIGYHLKSLSLTCDSVQGIEIFKKLDGSTCQLEELSLYADRMSTEILDTLGGSDQAKSIQKLSLYGMGPLPFTWLSKMVKIKTLRLEYLKGDDIETFPGVNRLEDIVISIDSILSECKKDTFESLIMKYATVQYKHDNGCYPFLKELEFNHCSCDSIDFLALISRTSNLNKLVMNEPTSNIDLNFPVKHHFKHLEIIMESISFAILHTDNNIIFFYDSDSPTIEGYSMFSMDAKKGRMVDVNFGTFHGIFTVRCSSVENFIFNGEYLYQF